MISGLLSLAAVVCLAVAAVLALRLLPASPRRRFWLIFAAVFILHLVHLLQQLFAAFLAGRSLPLIDSIFHLAMAIVLLLGVYAIRSVFLAHQQAVQARDDTLADRQQIEEDRFRLRTILETMPVGVCIMRSDGSIVEENEEAQRIWGGGNPSAKGLENYRAWWADTGKALHPEEWAAARAIRHGETVHGDLLHIRRFDGKRGAIINSAAPLYNRNGEQVGAVGVFLDFTLQQEDERKQARLTAELEAIFQTMGEGVVLYGPQGEVLRFNPAAQEIFNYSAEEWSRPVAERLSWGFKRDSSDQPFAIEEFPLSRALRGEVVHSEFISYSRSEENTMWLAVSAAPVLTQEQQILGAVITYGDVTRMRQLQQENQGYMHTITHDLRNPLTVVLGHAEMLQPEVLRSCQGEIPKINIESIILAGQQMEKMMEDLLDMAGLEGGAIHLQQEAVPLAQFLQDYLTRAQVSLDTVRIRLEIAASEPVAWVDPKYLERFLNNLLSNALKYSAKTTPVKLRVGTLNDQVLISVADRGPGICSEDLTRIFDRFYRAANAKGKNGLGLGLYITRLLVEAHGGRIWAESTPGQGSTFHMALPLVSAADMLGYRFDALPGGCHLQTSA